MPVVRRQELRPLLDRITVNPEHIFSVECRRRRPLYLRYEPIGQYNQGRMAYCGDHSVLATRRFVRVGRRPIVLEPANMLRKMIVKRKVNDLPMKHWMPVGGTLPYNPEDYGLYLVAGMYNDSPKNFGTGKRIGRHGDWRPFCFIDLLTTTRVLYDGTEFLVED